jgi:ABC-type lipoprotein release transport system permease subunit
MAAVSRWSQAPWWSPVLFGWVIVASPLVALVASWVPALKAAYQDPAEILREE